MKTFLTTSLLLAITVAAMAQNPDKALSRVSYSFTHVQDTTQRDKPHRENMLLVIGKNASVYTSYDKINKNIAMQKQLQEQIKNQAGSGGTMSLKLEGTSITKVSEVDYFYFANEQKLVTKERIFNNYLIEEAAPKIAWKIAKDTASFVGIKCQRATAYFKGRNWTAWFAPELPFQSGPWKLNGLPGLIIEAYDDKKEVLFQFAGMENVIQQEKQNSADAEPKIATPNGSLNIVNIMGMDSGSPYLGNEIKLPADAVKTTQKELDKLKDARAKDPQGFMQAQMAGSGMNVSVKSTQTGSISTAAPLASKNVINNPIELPEKK